MFKYQENLNQNLIKHEKLRDIEKEIEIDKRINNSESKSLSSKVNNSMNI